MTVVAQINTDYTVRKQQTTIVYINKKTEKRNVHVNWSIMKTQITNNLNMYLESSAYI